MKNHSVLIIGKNRVRERISIYQKFFPKKNILLSKSSLPSSSASPSFLLVDLHEPNASAALIRKVFAASRRVLLAYDACTPSRLGKILPGLKPSSVGYLHETRYDPRVVLIRESISKDDPLITLRWIRIHPPVRRRNPDFYGANGFDLWSAIISLGGRVRRVKGMRDTGKTRRMGVFRFSSKAIGYLETSILAPVSNPRERIEAVTRNGIFEYDTSESIFNISTPTSVQKPIALHRSILERALGDILRSIVTRRRFPVSFSDSLYAERCLNAQAISEKSSLAVRP